MRATPSRRGSTAAMASRALSTNKGTLTKSIAMTMPATFSVKYTESSASGSPTTPLRPNTMSRAIPAAVWGTMIGHVDDPFDQTLAAEIAPRKQVGERQPEQRRRWWWRGTQR